MSDIVFYKPNNVVVLISKVVLVWVLVLVLIEVVVVVVVVVVAVIVVVVVVLVAVVVYSSKICMYKLYEFQTFCTFLISTCKYLLLFYSICLYF